MYFKRCSNADCRRGFQVNRFAVSHPAPAFAGRIVCPHCGTSFRAASKYVFITHALSQEEEVAFDDLPLRQRSRGIACRR